MIPVEFLYAYEFTLLIINKISDFIAFANNYYKIQIIAE